MLRGKEKPAPGPSYMSDSQKAEYLRNLRVSNPRPFGSRPPPPARFTSSRLAETRPQTDARSSNEPPIIPRIDHTIGLASSEATHSRSGSEANANSSFAGRPLARPPSAANISEIPQVQHQRTPSYVERGTRWMEKQEARSLRQALEDMDQDEDNRVFEAAQDEAAELVWKHRNPDAPSAQPHAPYQNPDIRRDYHSHLRKGSYQRSQSRDSESAASDRKLSGGSHEEDKTSSISSFKRRSMEVLRKVSPPSDTVVVGKKRTPSGKSYGGLAEAVAEDIATAHRRSSSGSHRILSGEKKKMFMHPNDQIWEDPQEEHASQPEIVEPLRSNIAVQPSHVRKNPFARVRMQADKLERSRSEPIVSTIAHHSVEIQKNAPSQSRRAWYMSNEPLPPTPPRGDGQDAEDVAPKTTPTKEGIEVRDDDIRAATSKRRSDFSAKLPRPTMVSDKPGRPIVSFQDQKPKEIVLEEQQQQAAPFTRPETDPFKPRQQTRSPNSKPSRDSKSNLRDIPQIHVRESAKPSVPTIVVPDQASIPSIVLPDDPDFAESADVEVQSAPVTPTICVEAPEISIQPPEINVAHYSEEPSPRTMPFAQPWPTTAARRPLPTHAATSPVPRSKPHYTPSVRQGGTLCGHCALPIAGRILSAGGERFHPSCFVCHQCHTNLELVAFYPEPEKAHSERLARIQARQSGAPISIDELWRQELEDGDGASRFYCHLDFHELFSPRCKSCKTPIEGEVIVACGAEWHAGHFFCAQCGDPFDSTTPFVEKDGYAWCVGCHTNRFSSKCRKCKKPVTDTVVKALGHDWHENCFVCVVRFSHPRIRMMSS